MVDFDESDKMIKISGKTNKYEQDLALNNQQ